MKNLLLASTLLAGAAAPWTLTSSPFEQDALPQEPARLRELVQEDSASLRLEAGKAAELRALLMQESRASSDSMEAMLQAAAMQEKSRLYRELLDVERHIERMEREHEIEALQIDFEQRLAAREGERNLTASITLMEGELARLSEEVDRKTAIVEQESHWQEELLYEQLAEMHASAESAFARADSEFERAVELVELQLNAGEIEEQVSLQQMAELEAEYADRKDRSIAEMHAQERDLQEVIHAQAQGVFQHAMEREEALEAKRSALEEQLERLHWQLEDSEARLEVERELQSLRRSVAHEAKVHELEIRRHELEMRIGQADGSRISGSQSRAPRSVGSRVDGPFEESLGSEPSSLGEVLERLDRVEQQVDRLWSAIEGVRAEASPKLDRQNASVFQAPH